MTKTPEDDRSTWPPEQLDYAPGALVGENTYVNGFQMQVQIDGRWLRFDAQRTDRDEMTMVQAHRADLHPDEKRRILRIETTTRVYVDEVEGDGTDWDGETSREALLARNAEITKRRLAAEEAEKTKEQRKLRARLEQNQQ